MLEVLAGLGAYGHVGVERKAFPARATRFVLIHHRRRRAETAHRMTGARDTGHPLLARSTWAFGSIPRLRRLDETVEDGGDLCSPLGAGPVVVVSPSDDHAAGHARSTA
jgi:hypothetical protein